MTLRLTRARMASFLAAMILLDAAVRFPTITLLLLTAYMTLRDGRALLQARLGAALSISLAAMLVSTIPSPFAPPFSILAVAWFLHIPNTVFLWLFGLSLFQDDFHLRPIHWIAIGLVYLAIPLLELFDTIGFAPGVYAAMVLNRLVGFAAMAHLLWTALEGRKDDLVETRRRTRLWFVLVAALAATFILSAETVHYFATGGNEDPVWLSTSRAGIILPVTLFGAFWFLRLRPEALLFETAVQAPPVTPEVRPKDRAAHRRLITAMETEHLYREHGLSIGELATRIDLPEHQLRALINKGLGYRNFAAFLNTYRLAEAKTALADPQQARLPILTIAMDAGYASLATFNRAFKAAEGVTPSEFRSAALS